MVQLKKWPSAKLHLIPNGEASNWFSPKGFIANGCVSGVKKNGNKDIAIVLLDKNEISPDGSNVHASAVFTKNAFCAAPVQISRSILKQEESVSLLGLVVNSGCANACTGSQGLLDAKEMSIYLGSNPKEWSSSSSNNGKCLVMSTGVIGQPLQMEKIKKGLTTAASTAGSTFDHWMACAEGIMTTDTFPKLLSKEFKGKSKDGASFTYRMAGWSKGAGMIHPNMATMLSAVFTDFKISANALDKACKYAADRSFNAISIDGDTSTNDTFAIIANGASSSMKNVDAIALQDEKQFNEFQTNLTSFATDLAKLIVRDGEGATKFVQVKISGAKTLSDAKQVANSIVKSPLVKTAIYGKDANWGRIVCAVGYSAIPNLDPSRVNLWFGALHAPDLQLHLFKNGEPYDVNEKVASTILENEDLLVHVDLGEKQGHVFSMYTCDMSHEYISINADYRS